MENDRRLFQIGEVAALYGISRRMLLNYEALDLLRPTEVNPASGYRYYDIVTISKIGVILELRRSGMSLPDIGSYFKGRLSAGVQIEKMKEQIVNLQAAITQMEIRNTVKDAVSPVTETILPQCKCVCTEVTASDIENAVSLFTEAYGKCLREQYRFSEGCFNFAEFIVDVNGPDFFETENIKMKICVSVVGGAAGGLTIYPETRAVTASFCGSYEKSVAAYEKIRSYIWENGMEVSGYPREYYLEGNFNNDYDKNVVRIAVPVK